MFQCSIYLKILMEKIFDNLHQSDVNIESLDKIKIRFFHKFWICRWRLLLAVVPAERPDLKLLWTSGNRFSGRRCRTRTTGQSRSGRSCSSDPSSFFLCRPSLHQSPTRCRECPEALQEVERLPRNLKYFCFYLKLFIRIW